MTDIVTFLRRNAMFEAADEIERLRQRVNELEGALNQCRTLLKLANSDTQSAKEALAEIRKAQGEPVAWRVTYATIGTQVVDQPHLAELARDKGMHVEPLYTSAPPIPKGN